MGKIGKHAILTRQLLALVRATLWQRPVDCSLFTDRSVDWDALSELAFGQTVGPLACRSVFDLPPEQSPPQEWLRMAYVRTEQNRRTHRHLDATVAEAVASLKDAGIEPVLLKGQAYAAHYPEPALRQCGDIDLYIGGDNYRTACEAVRRSGVICEEVMDLKAKHYGYTLRGVRVELHRVPARLVSPSADRLFADWSRRRLSPDGLGSISLGGTAVAVPPPVFDVMFVFIHTYHHFINGGIGLRQVCDWAVLLHAHAGKFDVVELEACLHDFGLMRAWRRFTPIAVDSLDLQESECPFYSPEFRPVAERILNIIMREGNFGRFSRRTAARPAGYWRGKLYSFRHYSRRLMSLARIDPVMVMRAYGRYLFAGWRQVFKDMRLKF